jgi:hypothetical protein
MLCFRIKEDPQMSSSKAGKWAIILLLLGIIVLAFLWQKQKRERRRQQMAGRVPAVVSRVSTGSIPLTGDEQAWKGVNRLPLWEKAPEEGSETDWRAVHLAHDGETLYVLLSLPYPVETRAPDKKGTFILGQLRMDTDRNADTGDPLGAGENAMGIDRQITALARRKDAAAPLCVGYYAEDCSQGMPCKKIGDWVTTCSSADLVGYEGGYVAFGVPLSKLGLELPAKIIFAFQPFGGSGMKMYELSVQ